MGGPDSSWIPWHMVLDPIALSKALMFRDGCSIFIVGLGDKNEDVLGGRDATVTLQS